MIKKLGFLACAVSTSILLLSEQVLADSRRGLVTSGSCPLTCNDLRIPAADCKERTVGTECQVEDLRQPAGFQTVVQVGSGANKASVGLPGQMSGGLPAKTVSSQNAAATRESGQRGLVTSSNCPLSCGDLAVPSHQCEERALGSSCEVEDFRYGPGHQTLIRVPR